MHLTSRIKAFSTDGRRPPNRVINIEQAQSARFPATRALLSEDAKSAKEQNRSAILTIRKRNDFVVAFFGGRGGIRTHVGLHPT